MFAFLGAVLVIAAIIAFVSMAKSTKKLRDSDGSLTFEDKAMLKSSHRVASVAGAVCLVLGAGIIGMNCLYSQDAGEVIVLRSISGNIDGSTTDTGFHIKAPWQDIISYDTRNNIVSFISDGSTDYTGGSATGNQITINDKSGAKADVDIQVNYSLNPNEAIDLYSDYGTQETFVSSVVCPDIRSVTRDTAGQFDTITLLTNRGDFTKAVQDALTNKWKDYGLDVEQVSVQDIRYPESITTAYAQAQEAEIAKTKALNQQETAKVEAETKKIEAQGEADSNAILEQSLTQNVLTQHYIDALKEISKNGDLVVVPEGSTPLVMTPNGGSAAAE